MNANAQQHPDYALGHSDQELERLIRQSQYFDELTANVLRQAGLAEGMRVLDVGCGAGDVSFLAARLVGPRGAVMGIDTSADAVALASRRAKDAGLSNVRFLLRDATELELEQPIDALIGRLVLLYFADPAVALRRLTRLLRPGGVVVFHEMDMDGATSEPYCPTFEIGLQRIKDAFTRGGAEIRMGLMVSRVFQEAGLPAPRMVLGARVESGPEAAIYEQLAAVTRSLLPLMSSDDDAGVESDIETLASRLREEAVALDATLVSPTLIGAWARKEQ